MTPHRRLLVTVALMLLVGFTTTGGRQAGVGTNPPDVEALLQHLDDLYRSKSSVARIQIDVKSTRGTRSLRLKAWTRGEEEVLVVIEAPPREAGTATLRVGDNLWNYLPKIARTIRVPPAAMLGSWMGTDFTNDDLVKESSLRKDFAARIDRRSDSPSGWWLSFAGLRWSLRFYPTLAVTDVARTIGAVCITSLVASAWPAIRASRLQPVQALRGT